MPIQIFQRIPTVGEYYANLLKTHLNQPPIIETEIVVNPLDLALSEQIQQMIDFQKKHNLLLREWFLSDLNNLKLKLNENNKH